MQGQLISIPPDHLEPPASPAPRSLKKAPNRLAIVGVIVAAAVIGLAIATEQLWVLALLAILSTAVIWPIEIGFGLFAFLIPFDAVLIFTDRATTLSWAAGAFSGVFLLAYGLGSNRLHLPQRSAWWWGSFASWATISAWWAADSSASLKWTPTVLSLFALYLLVTSLQISDRELSRIVQFVIVGGTLAACVLLYQAHSLGLQERATLSFGGKNSNPNEVAADLLLPISLALGGVVSARRLSSRAAFILASTLMATGGFLTMSRGFLIALAMVLSVFFLRKGVRHRGLIALILVPVVAFPLLIMPSMFYQRLKEAPEGRGTGRLDILIVGTRIVASHPILGVGLANFNAAYNKYAGAAPVFRGYSRAPHNAYLQVWAETGIIGLALFVIAIWSQLAASRRAYRRCPNDSFLLSIEAACWGLLVMALAGATVWRKEFWLAFILLTQATAHTQISAGTVYASRSDRS